MKLDVKQATEPIDMLNEYLAYKSAMERLANHTKWDWYIEHYTFGTINQFTQRTTYIPTWDYLVDSVDALI
jgi:hypothetical protein